MLNGQATLTCLSSLRLSRQLGSIDSVFDVALRIRASMCHVGSCQVAVAYGRQELPYLLEP
jgi:hypothetical protein